MHLHGDDLASFLVLALVDHTVGALANTTRALLGLLVALHFYFAARVGRRRVVRGE